MKKLSDYLEEKRGIRLKEVNFTAVEMSDQDSDFIVNDYYIVSKNEKEIIVTVTREVGFEPENGFKISASYDIIYKLIEDLIDEFNESNIDIEKEIAEDKETYIWDEMNRISLIISQLTSSFDNIPFVTRPFIRFEEPAEEE